MKTFVIYTYMKNQLSQNYTTSHEKSTGYSYLNWNNAFSYIKLKQCKFILLFALLTFLSELIKECDMKAF